MQCYYERPNLSLVLDFYILWIPEFLNSCISVFGSWNVGILESWNFRTSLGNCLYFRLKALVKWVW